MSEPNNSRELVELAAEVLDLEGTRDQLSEIIRAKKDRLAELAGTRDEGAMTVEVGDFKITTRVTMRRSIIEDELEQALKALKPEHLDVVRVKHSVNKRRLDALEREDPQGFLAMTRAIEMKDQAIGVTVRRVEEITE